MQTPDGGFKIIYADPPWKYRDKANAGKRGASHKYRTMSLGDLLNLRNFVDALAAKDCALALWATSPLLPTCLELLNGWGFKYRTVLFCWAKTSKGSPIGQSTMSYKWHFGMGHYSRMNVEMCLLATRGRVRRQSASVRQLLVAPLRQHSRKPEEARERLVQLFGDVPRVELFARESAEGWASWGNETNKFKEPIL